MATESKAEQKQNLTAEIATVRRDITIPFFSNVLTNQDDTLAARGGHKGLKIYDELERDGKVFSALQKRKLAVIGRPFQVDPASDSTRDKTAAEMVARNVNGLNFDKTSLDALDAILKGYSIGEIMWKVVGREYMIDRIISRNQRRFTFDLDHRPRMLTPENRIEGIELPERKFIVHTYGGKDGTPFGLGLGTRLFWPTFFKRQDIAAWLVFLDKYASPTAVGKYPRGTLDGEEDKLLAALESIAQETGVTIPDDMTIEFIEATRQGSSDAYERMARYMDEQIEEIILGTSNSGKNSGGALAAAAVTKKEARLELVKADADLLSETFTNTISKWLVELNMPGAGVPRISRIVEEPKDLKARAERDKTICGMGFKPTLEYILETYGVGWEADEKTPAAVKAAAKGAPEFSEPSGFPSQDALDGALAQLDLQGEAVKLVQPLIDAISNAASYEDAYNALAEAYPNMNTEALANMLARIEFVSHLVGMQSVLDETQ